MTTTEGFPELIFEPKCRLCQLAKSHAGLLTVVHRYWFVEGLGRKAISNRIKETLVSHGLHPIQPRTIARHFDRHINADQVPKPDVHKGFKMPPPRDLSDAIESDEHELLSVNPHNMALGKNDSDYHSMVDLFRRLMRRIAALDADPTAFITDDGRHSMQRLSIWSGMISNAKSILEGLNRMRNQDRMTVSILEKHTEEFAIKVATPIGDVLRSVRADLLAMRSPKGNELAARVSLLLDSEISDVFASAAESSLASSREKYKLMVH